MRTTTAIFALALALALAASVLPPAGGARADAARPLVGEPASDPITQRPCFGAPARDPLRPCRDRSLRLAAFPTPRSAVLEPNAPCVPLGRRALLYPCRFGAARPGAPMVAALIGDSHASHWRAAIDEVAARKGWTAVSLTRTGCPFMSATIAGPRREQRACTSWRRGVLEHLRAHPEIETVFISHRANAEFVRRRGRSNHDTQILAHRAIWRALPRSVRQIVVLRDVPRSSLRTAGCVERALARRRAGGLVCSRRRARAVRRDPAMSAARQTRSRRVAAIDLTPIFCSRRRCFPVIGGALVYKDEDHLTAIFSRTLGRFVGRELDRALVAAGEIVLDVLEHDERVWAQCILDERRLALEAGGWERIPLEHLERAQACRAQLERRADELRASGLTGARRRAQRHAVIGAVLG